MNDRQLVVLTVNGTEYEVLVEARRTLSDLLRHDLELTGTHVGCEHGVCGACTSSSTGRPVRACLMFAVQAEGADIRTVESLDAGGELGDLQRAFGAHHGLQCGFCTPGFLMLAEGFLAQEPDADRDAVREALSANLCRCTGYQTIVDAVADVAARRRDREGDRAVILDNHLDLPADPDAVFALLNDVERVAGCLPGAVLDGQEDDTYLGRVRFKVGPISAAYAGRIRFTEVAPEQRRLRLSARGADSHGNGDAEADVTLTVAPADGRGLARPAHRPRRRAARSRSSARARSRRCRTSSSTSSPATSPPSCRPLRVPAKRRRRHPVARRPPRHPPRTTRSTASGCCCPSTPGATPPPPGPSPWPSSRAGCSAGSAPRTS